MTPTSAQNPNSRTAGASGLQVGQTGRVAAPARIWALIPAAGSGSRAGGDLPKQYQTVAGQPMLVHCLNAFAQVPQVAGTLLVLNPSDTYFSENIEHKITINSPLFIAGCGGITRLESVLSGLEYLETRYSDQYDWINDWIMVHDAARCLITPGQIQGLIDAVQGDAVGGLLALKVPDTLKAETDGRVAETVDRAGKWLAQTPQMFRAGLLLRALRQASAGAGAGVTDESGAVEQLGLRPKLVQGSAQNFKVTYPEDFALADRVLRGRTAEAASHHVPPTDGPNTSYDYP